MKHKKIFSLASVAAMLACWMAVPVNAASVNQYEISCETLTSAVTVGDTVVAPGTVAITMSIDGNTGFQSNTLALQLDENYKILKTAGGDPVLQTGEVLEDFHAFAAENDNKICVAVASGFTTSCDGDLFTIYATEKENAEICSSNVAVIAEPDSLPSAYALQKGVVGDVNNDDLINASDAADIYGAVSKNNGTAIMYTVLVTSFYDGKGQVYFRQFFPNALHPDSVNCYNADGWDTLWENTEIDTRMIDNNDGDAILQYCAGSNVGSGAGSDGKGENLVGNYFYFNG